MSNEGLMRRELIKWLSPCFYAKAIETEETQKGYPDIVAHMRAQDELAAVFYIECKDCSEISSLNAYRHKIPFRPGQYAKLWEMFITGAVSCVCMKLEDIHFSFIWPWAIDPVTMHPECTCSYGNSEELKGYLLQTYAQNRKEYITKLKGAEDDRRRP